MEILSLIYKNKIKVCKYIFIRVANYKTSFPEPFSTNRVWKA